jgi:hypothetical protein
MRGHRGHRSRRRLHIAVRPKCSFFPSFLLWLPFLTSPFALSEQKPRLKTQKCSEFLAQKMHISSETNLTKKRRKKTVFHIKVVI